MKLTERKEVKYALGVAVLVIWGMIIRTIVIAVKGGDNPVIISPPVVKKAFNDFTLPPDTGALLLNYRDPFLSAERDTVLNLPQKKTTVAPSVPRNLPVAMNWGFIKYSGYVHNPGAKNRVALVTINNKLYMMKEGDTEGQVKLVKNLLDSIQVAYNGKTTFIRIK